MTKQKAVLLIPSVRRGNGSGHIKRCAALAEELINIGADASILVECGEGGKDCYTIDEVALFFGKTRRRKPDLVRNAAAKEWDISVFDSRQTPSALFEAFSGRTICLGIDEGGPLREYFDYLVDILPNLEKVPANIISQGFLQLPPADEKTLPPDAENIPPVKKVLITFGGEDAADLTGRFLDMIHDTGVLDGAEVTVVTGPLFKNKGPRPGVTTINAPGNLAELLVDYDLVVTSFGITCFEALHTHVPAVLFNPSQYHKSLSVRAGLPEIGVLHPDAGKLEEYLGSPEKLYRPVRLYSELKRLNLAEFILQKTGSGGNFCRGCGRKTLKVIYRDLNRSYTICSDCGMVNQLYFGDEQIAYSKDYFFEDYKKQYGRTYLEDFDKIKEIGKRRCREIRKKPGARLLDIGCGYGPFLSAAAESGFRPYGVDVCKEAISFVNSELGFPAVQVPIEDLDMGEFGPKNFDIVTMWYVIEHLQGLPAVLSKVNALLGEGGVFAFATPNYNGITRLRDQSRFFKESPLDHYTIWSRRSVKRVLGRYGFKTKKIISPSAHPARFLRNREQYENGRWFWKGAVDRVLTFISRKFLLGDTFEIYAVKKFEIKEDGAGA